MKAIVWMTDPKIARMMPLHTLQLGYDKNPKEYEYWPPGSLVFGVKP